MRLVIAIVPLLLVSACAAPVYVRPETPNQSASAAARGTKPQILNAAVKTLVENGYQITAVDNASGLVSTAPRSIQVTPEQADCGRVKGLFASADPLTYPHPNTRVAFSILAEDNRIEVRSKIDDRLEPGSIQSNLTCTSRGVLDREMLNAIEARLQRSP